MIKYGPVLSNKLSALKLWRQLDLVIKHISLPHFFFPQSNDIISRVSSGNLVNVSAVRMLKDSLYSNTPPPNYLSSLIRLKRCASYVTLATRV